MLANLQEQGEGALHNCNHILWVVTISEGLDRLQDDDETCIDLTRFLGAEERDGMVKVVGPLSAKVADGNELYAVCDLDADGARGCCYNELEQALLEGRPIDWLDGDLVRFRVLVVDKVRTVDAVLEPHRTRLPHAPVVQEESQESVRGRPQHVPARTTREKTHISTPSAPIICITAAIMPGSLESCTRRVRRVFRVGDGTH